MTRLTTHIRDSVVANVMTKAGLYARGAAVKESRQKWAEEIRLLSLGKHSAEIERVYREAEQLTAKLPEELRGSGDIVRKVGRLRLNLAGRTVLVSEWEGVLPALPLTLTAESPMVARFDAIVSEEGAIESEGEALRTQVRAVLGSVTTVAKLLSIWPEARELLPTTLAETKPQLPAVQLADLNRMCGLPTEDKTDDL